eukprot:Skav232333  [mRNA]  locus=scaffold1704:191581:199177:+ [translate_table: standard]
MTLADGPDVFVYHCYEDPGILDIPCRNINPSAGPSAKNPWIPTKFRRQDGQYWTKHMRGTVLWRENAERLMSQWRPSIVLEVGPGNVLSTLTSKCVKSPGWKPDFLQSMRHPKATKTHDVEAFLGALGKLWEAGCNINWDQLHTKVLGGTRLPPLTRLPAYSFEETSLWVNPERSVYVDSTEAPAMESVALEMVILWG